MSSMGQLTAPGAGDSAGFNEGAAHLPSVPAQRFNAEEAVRALRGLGEGLNAARVVREEQRSLTMPERLPAWTRGSQYGSQLLLTVSLRPWKSQS